MNYGNDFNAYNNAQSKTAVIFSSPLFLAVAVLTSVNALFSFDVFSILGTVAAWLIYYTAFNSARNPGTPLKTAGFSMVYGTTRALKIVYLVLSIIMIIASVILLAVTVLNSGFILSLTPGYIYKLIPEIITDPELAFEVSAAYDEFLINLFTVIDIPSELFGTLILVALITVSVVSILSGVFQLVLSFTFCRSLCKFTCSLRDSVMLGVAPKRVKGLGVWFLVLGILYVISSPMMGALLIVLYVWYRNSFPAVPNIQVNV